MKDFKDFLVFVCKHPVFAMPIWLAAFGLVLKLAVPMFPEVPTSKKTAVIHRSN